MPFVTTTRRSGKTKKVTHRYKHFNITKHLPHNFITPQIHTMSTCKPLLRMCSRQRQPSLLPFTQYRNESTTRRHRKLLALPEAPSYTSDRSSPTLIFNPPSSAPNVYHTPLKFLPKEDKRRQLYAAAQIYTTTAAHRRQTPSIASLGTPLSAPSALPPRPSAALPAPVRTPYEKKYHLSAQEIEEIRRLRASDPDQWTRIRLAEKFGCSQFFVGMVAKASEKAERVSREHERNRRKWGSTRRLAREDRERRKVLWGRDA